MEIYQIVLLSVLGGYIFPAFLGRYLWLKEYEMECKITNGKEANWRGIEIKIGFVPIFNILILIPAFYEYVHSRTRMKVGLGYWLFGDKRKDQIKAEQNKTKEE